MSARAMRRSRARRIRRAATMAAATLIPAGLGIAAGPARAHTFVVTSAHDGGAGSLRGAISRADHLSGADRIEFSRRLDGPVEIRRDLRVHKGVTIVGRRDGGPTLVAKRWGHFLNPFPRLLLGDLPKHERLSLRRVTSRNLGVGEFQSAADEEISVVDSTFTSNRPHPGTALLLYGPGRVSGVTVTGWDVGVTAYDPGNRADPARVTVANSVLHGNGTGISTGGPGRVRISEVKLTGNETGLATIESDLSVVEATISGNAPGSGIDAGLRADYGFYPAGDIEIRRSTIANNEGHFGGGIAMYDGDLRLINSTVSGNAALADDDDSLGVGGGIEGVGSEIRVEASTITGNSADLGGGIAAHYGHVAVESSILAGNSAPDGPDCAPTSGSDPFSRASKGGNVFGEEGCGPSKPSDLLTAEPGLRPLADNGGRTLTHALRKGSPAIDNAHRLGLKTDQRGVKRGKKPDSGAFERRREPR